MKTTPKTPVHPAGHRRSGVRHFACFMLTKHKKTDSASSAAASVSQFGSVADFDYEAFDYSDGLDENGYWAASKRWTM